MPRPRNRPALLDGACPPNHVTSFARRDRADLRGTLKTFVLTHVDCDLDHHSFVQAMQQKSFTRWLNLHLREKQMVAHNIFEDLKSGLLLMALMEKLSGESLPKPSKGRMRVHHMENCQKVLQFVKDKGVRLESIGAGDIVDSTNHTLILGLIWTLILRFEITGVEIEGADAKSAKEALLIWCQRNTAGFANVSVKNFTSSWQSGLGFCALIAKFCPQMLDYRSLNPDDHERNLETAFMVADQQLGIERLLDVEDVAEMPEEKSIMTYLYMYYNKFNSMGDEDLWQRRLANVLEFEVEMEAEQSDFMVSLTDLLRWAEEKAAELRLRDFPNSVQGVQGLLAEFKQYRTVEKPPRFVQKGTLDAKLFNIQASRRRAGRPLFAMAAGQDMVAMNKAWAALEAEEHARDVALFDELLRLERLERMAEKFSSKSKMREAWLQSTQETINIENFGEDIWSVRAAEHRSQAITTSLKGYEDRFYGVGVLCKQLVSEDYHDSPAVQARSDDITKSWLDVNVAAEMHDAKAKELVELYQVFSVMDQAEADVAEYSVPLSAEGTGKSLDEAEDLMKSCEQVMTAVDTIKAATTAVVERALDGFIERDHPRLADLEDRNDAMLSAFEAFDLVSLQRKMVLAEVLE